MSYSFSNTTAGDQYNLPIALGMVTNYAKVVDEPAMCRLSNKTASLEQPELVTYRSEQIDKVSTAIPVRYPSEVRNGVQYTVKIETVDRITSGGVSVDEPIVAWLTIKHANSNNWDNAKVAGIIKRLLGACSKGQTTTGTPAAVTDATGWRFEDLMRSALAPTTD
jgi:hypothetical protein